MLVRALWLRDLARATNGARTIYMISGNQVILSSSLSCFPSILVELTIVMTAIRDAYGRLQNWLPTLHALGKKKYPCRARGPEFRQPKLVSTA